MSIYDLNEADPQRPEPFHNPLPPHVVKQAFPIGPLIVALISLLVLGFLMIPVPPRRTTLEKATHLCGYLKSKYARTPVGKIPLEDAEHIVMCKAAALW